VGQNKQDLESAVIEYTANSRGFYQKITIQNQMVLISKDRSGKRKAVATKIAADDWEELVVCFKKIELDNLSKLKAPTEKRFMTVRNCYFKITFKDETYKSPSFDHGFPKNIEQSVNKINSFVKQKKMKIKEIQDEIVDEFSMFDD
jgi:predicted ribonuclease YlaK